MDDQTKKLLAAAVVGGYVLGRTKKGRLALTAVTFLTGRKLGLEPRELLAEGARRIADMPQVAQLQEQLRNEGLEAGRKALSAVADRSLGSLADAIGSRTAALGLGEEDEEGEDGEEEDEPGEDEYEADYEEDEEERGEDEEAEDEYEEEDEEAEEPPRRRTRSGSSRGAAPAKRQPAKKAAPARKTAPAKNAATKKPSPARKPAPAPKKAAKKTSPRADGRR